MAGSCTIALQRARNVAKSLKVEPPAEPSKDAQGYYDGLAQLSGSEFDAAFLSHMVRLHEAEIANYARNSSSDHDAVASFVASTSRSAPSSSSLPRIRRPDVWAMLT